MSKHTPGPWYVSNGTQIRSQRDQIAKVWMMRNGEGNANARLIAAASDLLEALEYAVKQVPELAGVPGIKAALAKARGEA